MLSELHQVYPRLFPDIASALHDVVADAHCQVEIRDAALRFVQRQTKRNIPLNMLLDTLSEIQKSAEDAYREAVNSGQPKPLEWNPRAVRLFVRKVGPFLPVQVQHKVTLKSGAFEVSEGALPLSMIRIVDQEASSPLRDLMKGRSDDYFARGQAVRTVIVPRHDSDLLMLGILSHFFPEKFKLEFVSFSKELFKELTTEERWEALTELFSGIVQGQGHPSEPPGKRLTVRALGYLASNLPPLLISSERDAKCLVINGYNDLAKAIRDEYSKALAANNIEVRELISHMCHELYHHAQPADLEPRAGDLHFLNTRVSLFKNMLEILQKYQ